MSKDICKELRDVSRRSPSGISGCCLDAANEIEVLRAENETLRTDAERYRWVRDKAFRCDPDMSGNHTWWSVQPRPQLRGNTIDAAIDAALAAKGK